MSGRLWGGHPVPFTLLGGYLGAGKTTIVNRVLAGVRDRHLVVLVNDVGAINVDAALIAAHDGQTLTMTNGCVCCSISDDFGQTLEQVRSLAEAPDHVLMELSGVGEPARLAPWANTTGFRLDGIVMTADADQIVEMAQRRFVGDTIREQLRSADVILLTKIDLTDDGGAAARAFAASSSDAPVIDAADPADASLADVVLGIRSSRSPAEVRAAMPARYDTTVIDASGLTSSELGDLVAAIEPEVIRAKGLVTCVDRPHPVEVHVVGRRRTITERPDLPSSSAADQLVQITVPTVTAAVSDESRRAGTGRP